MVLCGLALWAFSAASWQLCCLVLMRVGLLYPSPRLSPLRHNTTPRRTSPSLNRLQISLYINSPGGVVTAGLAIYDTMQVGGLGWAGWWCTWCCVRGAMVERVWECTGVGGMGGWVSTLHVDLF